MRLVDLDPRTFFLIDGLGAILSAFLLGVLLVSLQAIVGIPIGTLYFLAIVPCIFAIYDVFCYLSKGNNTAIYLVGISVMNLLYCILSIGLSLHHHDSVTALGWAYILFEVVIVLALARVEFKVGSGLFTRQK